MSKPEDIPQDVWDEASKADADCQRNSCKEAGCNGFLCVRALRIAILAAKAEERESVAAYHDDLAARHEETRDGLRGPTRANHGLMARVHRNAAAAIRKRGGLSHGR